MKREDYVSLEVAKLLERKGFNEPCDAIYIESPQEGRNEFHSYITDDIKKSSGIRKIKNGCRYDEYLAPALYVAAKWLRVNHRILVTPYYVSDDKYTYHILRMDAGNNYCHNNYLYDSYEEALNAGIEEALKLI